jgi:hydroxymethylbilane synthase
VPIRGNVDTRMARVTGRDGGPGDLDAVVLARAGLARLGRLDAVTEVLDPIQVLPAPAQGALAVECRSDDTRLRELLADLEDPAARACVAAERAVLAALEAGCSAPVAAHAELAEDEDGAAELYLRASVTAIDGSDAVRGSLTGPAPAAEDLGRQLAAELLDRGAAALLAGSR